jgi:hypothetical protein
MGAGLFTIPVKALIIYDLRNIEVQARLKIGEEETQ